MALVSRQHAVRVVPDHEPESWFLIRPIKAGDFEALEMAGSQVRISLDLLATLILEWSYEAEVTRENVADLDLDTFTFLTQQLMDLSNIRTEAEKKVSSSGLSPISPPPPAADSPSNSLISLNSSG